MSDPVAALGRLLGWTPAQAWTALPALALAVPVALVSITGVLSDAPAAPPAPSSNPAPTPASTPAERP